MAAAPEEVKGASVALAEVQRAVAAGQALPAVREEAVRPPVAPAKGAEEERAEPVAMLALEERAALRAKEAREGTQLRAARQAVRQGAQVQAAPQVAEARVALPARQTQDRAARAVQADPAAALAQLAQEVPRAKVAMPAQPDR